jgi:hypothetical protein
MEQYLPWELNWFSEGQDVAFISDFIVLSTKTGQLTLSEVQNTTKKVLYNFFRLN